MALRQPGSRALHRDAVYIGAVVATFLPLYLLTRPIELVYDGAHWVEMAYTGDPSALQYGEVAHFLQIPLARWLWRALNAAGVPVDVLTVFLGVALAATLVAIVYTGLVAEQLHGGSSARWLGAALFGTSLHAWMLWNGELYALAFGFIMPALYYTLHGGIVVPAALLALSALSHVEFALIGVALASAAWMRYPVETASWWRKARRASLIPALAAILFVIGLLLGGLAVGKWKDLPGLEAWLARMYQSRAADVGGPFPLRAMKGLVTAQSVAGHYVRDLSQEPGAVLDAPALLAVAIVLTTGFFIVLGAAKRKAFFLGLAWVLPVHVLFNWSFGAAVEKYHGAALPGFLLLVIGGLVWTMERGPWAAGRWMSVAYIGFVASMNLLGSVLPQRAITKDSVQAWHAIQALRAERGGRVAFVTCDSTNAVVRADVEYLEIHDIWAGSVQEIQAKIVAWIQARLDENKTVYLLGARCRPEEWATQWSKAPFELRFLEQHFAIVPTPITNVPIWQPLPTNPRRATRGDVVQLKARQPSA